MKPYVNFLFWANVLCAVFGMAFIWTRPSWINFVMCPINLLAAWDVAKRHDRP